MNALLKTTAIVLEKPENICLSELDLIPATTDDIIVEVEWSGISTGTEKLLWTGQMPSFPGMGYPLVPGYESVGRVIQADDQQRFALGQRVFIPGSSCFVAVRGLFGGAASRLIVPAKRAVAVAENVGEEVILYALAATAYHVTAGLGNEQPDLIVGHGVLGRLLARLAVLAGKQPVVWEIDAQRREGAVGYQVVDPQTCAAAKYKTIVDVSGDAKLLDNLVSHLAPGGEIVLAGFYDTITFAFPAAFMREARIRIAAQWQPSDLTAIHQLVESGNLSLADLITHRASPQDAAEAYRTAFHHKDCLKMVLDWRTRQ
ncbi:chlorophyll synthesis pathway protein BchC [Polynucleobacter sp. IMCC 29146]|uniref:chlorophyll synthesis pathway protein BchC n=1 Tax=Polynucleobacter sp. IMCC 29146 TaxID=2780953 RepID=UPI001F24AD39|nr:chlorophyll synthesis pathway protein BchC [Polynucleobacter sp. IMCC 29146]MCE7528438.1 chlorophyll synthesis pathway protein BchC [Polynucleobacter sp. IMCC 29146]